MGVVVNSGDSDPLNGAPNRGDTICSHSSSAGNSINAANEARYDDEPEAGAPIMRPDGWVVEARRRSYQMNMEIMAATSQRMHHMM